MWTEALSPIKNLGHYGLARVARDPHTSLTALAGRYFLTQVASQAEGTQDAKRLSPLTIARTYASVRHLARWIHVSPHVVRHTLLSKVANEKGVHYAMELSGHRSDRYIWRYVKPDAQSLADAIDELD